MEIGGIILNELASLFSRMPLEIIHPWRLMIYGQKPDTRWKKQTSIKEANTAGESIFLERWAICRFFVRWIRRVYPQSTIQAILAVGRAWRQAVIGATGNAAFFAHRSRRTTTSGLKPDLQPRYTIPLEMRRRGPWS